MPGSHSRVVSFFSAFKISHSSSNTRSPWVIVVFTTGWMNKATDIVKRMDESTGSRCIFGMNEDENLSLAGLLTFLAVRYKTLTLKKWRNQFKVSVKKKLRVSWSHHTDTVTLTYILWFGSIAGLAENWMQSAADWAQWRLCFSLIVVCVLFVLEDCVCVILFFFCFFSMPFSLKFWDHTENERYKVYFKPGRTY